MVFRVFLGIRHLITAQIGWFPTRGRNGQGSLTPLCTAHALRLNLKLDKDDDWRLGGVNWFQTKWDIHKIENLKALMRDLGIERE